MMAEEPTLKKQKKSSEVTGSVEAVPAKEPQDKKSLYALSANDIDGKECNLKAFEGKVSLVVNVASECGRTTSSYRAMNDLYKTYEAKGFTVLAFPCNQFGAQEPGSNQQIKQFATSKFEVKFPMFSKIDVKGDKQSPIYKLLLDYFPGDVTWNFANKFLIGRDGVPKQRFDKATSWDEIEVAVKAELASKL
eukprot:gb/GEZN01012171.1/.p1 GENE.gb/GEZN01012171.1/~~gb/GEZN01012171.1/.p1  ORF type:complete len:192 (-),score=47.62 gb/GEZN01012171.1/:461-1036(-)